MLIYRKRTLWLSIKTKWYRKAKKAIVAEWDRDLTESEVNAIESGYSPLFFKKGLQRYYNYLGYGTLLFLMTMLQS